MDHSRLRFLVGFCFGDEGDRNAGYLGSLLSRAHAGLGGIPVAALVPDGVSAPDRKWAANRVWSGLTDGRDHDKWVEIEMGDAATFSFGPGDILVDPHAPWNKFVTRLWTAKERDVRGGEGRPFRVLVPYGSRPHVVSAFRRAVPLLRQLRGVEVVFYHTTYAKPGCNLDVPSYHQGEESLRVFSALCEIANAEKIQVRDFTAMASSVADGIVAAALDWECQLILAAQNPMRYGKGYCQELVERSPVPVLVMGVETAEEPLPQERQGRPSASGSARKESAERGWFMGPYGVMTVVLAMYAAKVAGKLAVGYRLDSTLLVGDGFHNLSDIFQALLVMLSVWISRRPASERYPFGLRGADGIMGMLIGLSLATAAVVEVAWPAAIGLWSVMSGSEDPSIVSGSGWMGIAVALAAMSAISSFVVSAYQIRVGRMTGHASVVADGEETRSDGMIEIAAVVGLVTQYFLGGSYPLAGQGVGHVAGMLVALAMFRTAWEIVSSGARRTFNGSLGAQTESLIRGVIVDCPGVTEYALTSYYLGACQVAEVSVVSELGADAAANLAAYLRRRIAEVLAPDGNEARVSVSVSRPERKPTRWAFLADRQDKRFRIVAEPPDANTLVVCEVEAGTIVSCRHEPVARDGDIARLIAEKRINELRVPSPMGELVDTSAYGGCLPNDGNAAVQLMPVGTADPILLGIPLI